MQGIGLPLYLWPIPHYDYYTLAALASTSTWLQSIPDSTHSSVDACLTRIIATPQAIRLAHLYLTRRTSLVSGILRHLAAGSPHISRRIIGQLNVNMVVATTDVWPNTAGFDTDYEEHEPVELTVKGTIPRHAAGVLYRTGPLGYKAKTNDGKIWAARHWFDGFSCVHRFQIDFPDADGPAKVTYRSRRTVDEYLEIVRTTGKLDSTTFAAKRDPCESFFWKVSPDCTRCT